MKIAVIGASGRVGHLIVQEALARGIDVTAVVRDSAKVDGMPVIEKDIMSLTAEDVSKFDAVVSALGIWDASKFDLFTTTTKHLCSILANTNIRLLIVGGAGSLFVNPEHTLQIYQSDGFPEANFPLASAMAKQLSYLRTRNDVKWTYLSPAESFDAKGERTGKFIVGGEEAIKNSAGKSYISYADYAIAMVDELEKAEHIQQRFSVIGE